MVKVGWFGEKKADGLGVSITLRANVSMSMGILSRKL
jgi:hypothetical protein